MSSLDSIKPLEKPVSILATGLALFSMFFGAGNIVFPLIVGRLALDQISYAIVGLAISAVAFPFLGLYAMMLYGGNIQSFLARIGKWPALILLFILQMSQGPVGAIPRLVTLMHATIKSYLPALPLLPFSIAICALVFWLCRRPSRIIPLLGVVLTPVLLLTLTVLVIFGSIWAPEVGIAPFAGSYYVGLGLKLGYQTTDLLAALLFAGVVLPHLSQGTNDPKEIRRRMTWASLIASGLLMVVYVGLCWISASYSSIFINVPPEELLQTVAIHVLGPFGTLFSSTATFLACLTTAISLSVVFSEYLKKDLFKMDSALALGLTLGISAALANIGFSGIVKLWGPLLDVLYPGLIVLCLFNIAHRLYSVHIVKSPVFFMFGFTIGALL